MPESDLPPVHVGDHVQDKEDDDATLLVTGISPQDASHYTVNGDATVADYNKDYPSDDDVVEVVYPQRSTVDVSRLEVYAFPRSRLELAAPLHDRSDSDEDVVECAACGKTGPAEEIQPTACPHDTLADLEADA